MVSRRAAVLLEKHVHKIQKLPIQREEDIRKFNENVTKWTSDLADQRGAACLEIGGGQREETAGFKSCPTWKWVAEEPEGRIDQI